MHYPRSARVGDRLYNLGMTTPPHAAGIAFLASGSRGNATLVYDGGRGVLVDCGLSARETRRRIDAAELGGIRIEALLVTHEHSDHVAGVRVLSRSLGVPVYATRATVSRLHSHLADVPDACEIRPGETFALASFSVTAFRTSHDAADPVGYVFEDAAGRRIGIMTDTGVLTTEIAEAIADCDLLGIESNHDYDMLEGGAYPRFLKQRILSDRGHLSNRSAGDALERIASDRLHTIVGLHLSEQNNLPRLARASIGAAARSLGLVAEVHVASQSAALVCALADPR
jgi:phosphoribosyl 1,2-cyclic phosphodiesterase